MGIRIEPSNRPSDARKWVPGPHECRPFVESLRANGAAEPDVTAVQPSRPRRVPGVLPSQIGLRGASDNFKLRAAPYLREMGAFMQRVDPPGPSSVHVASVPPSNEEYRDSHDACAVCASGLGLAHSSSSSDAGSSDRDEPVDEHVGEDSGVDDLYEQAVTPHSSHSDIGSSSRYRSHSDNDSSRRPASSGRTGIWKTGTSTPTTRPGSHSTARPGSRSTANASWSRPSTSGLSAPPSSGLPLSRPSSSPHLTRPGGRSGVQLGRPSSSPHLARRPPRGRPPSGLTRALEQLAAAEDDDAV